MTSLKPPSEEYSDEVLFGPQRDISKLLDLMKLGNETDCVIYGVKTFVNKRDRWGIKELQGVDKRIKSMLNELNIKHGFPVQRLCWPQLYRSQFPFLCVSPQSSGKTYAHLLYIVSRCITRIPFGETDKTIMSTGQLGTFKTQEVELKSKLKNFDPSNIDQKDFDFDSLGYESDPGNETSEHAAEKTATQNGHDIEQEKVLEQTSSGWANLETTEHYEVNPDDFITHPKCIIICSSQQQVALVERQVDSMKLAAFGDKAATINRQNLPPITRTVNLQHSDDKLALKCNDSEILIATPAAILKCLKLNYLTFNKCEKLIFDDLDITLQLHNPTIRDLIKHYLVESQLDEEDESKICQVFMFSRKWTLLVQKFVSTIFLQRTLIFGSIIEASLYANLRFELEIPIDIASKLNTLSQLTFLFTSQQQQLNQKKMAIVCKTNEQARKVTRDLIQRGLRVTFLDDTEPIKGLESVNPKSQCIYVLCDSSIEQIDDLLDDIQHLVHFTLPEDFHVLDQRFRLMHKRISDSEKNLTSTIFMNQKISTKFANELYDVISRSNTTLNSTKFQLRDFISDKSHGFCWRWASTGSCRLDKFSRDDKFGSYCSLRHSLPKTDANCKTYQFPRNGQVKITITHLVSPNEFFFRFEAYRDKNSLDKQWTKLDGSGSQFMKELQSKLDTYKDSPSCSVPLEKISKGKVYGIYSQEEVRVDRIVLLEELKRDDIDGAQTKKNGLSTKLNFIRYQLEYSKQYEALKIDYGLTVNVYLRNIFELPQDISSIKPQCQRGFHLGVKPTDNEPCWSYKAKKYFYDQVCVSDLYDITAWLRLEHSNCFWFEGMVVKRILSNIDEIRPFASEPHKNLHKAGFADLFSSEPSCLGHSERLETLSLWRVNECVDYVQYAFLRKDKPDLTIMVTQISEDFDFTVRNHDYNKQLIDLEDRIMEDYRNNKLEPLNYFAIGTYCLAKIKISADDFIFNRCQIKTIKSELEASTSIETDYSVYCLDHGDTFRVRKCDLFLAQNGYIAQLPFQAISRKLADLNLEILEEKILRNKVISAMYDFTRDEHDNLLPVKCVLDEEGNMYLYVPYDKGHVALADLIENELGVNVFFRAEEQTIS